MEGTQVLNLENGVYGLLGDIRESCLIDFRVARLTFSQRSALLPADFLRSLKAQSPASRLRYSAIFSYKTSYSCRPNVGTTVGYSTSCSFVGGGIVSHAVRRTSSVTRGAGLTTGPHSLPCRKGWTCSSTCTISTMNTVRPPTIV